MAIYQYKAIAKGCPYCQDGFEVMQSMNSVPLKKCPRCSQAIKKVPSACSGFTPLLSNSNLRDKGFTKLQNKGDGTFEKLT